MLGFCVTALRGYQLRKPRKQFRKSRSGKHDNANSDKRDTTHRYQIRTECCSVGASLSALRAGELPYYGKEGNGLMSHHLDTPLAAQNGQLYIDDLYVFSGDDSTVFIMDVNSNITGVHVKPGFHPEARYEFKLHFDGADFETLTYRVSFDEPGSDGRQVMKLHALTGAETRQDFRSRRTRAGRPHGRAGQRGRRPFMGRAYCRSVLH